VGKTQYGGDLFGIAWENDSLWQVLAGSGIVCVAKEVFRRIGDML
jgi:hypothetical protein